MELTNELILAILIIVAATILLALSKIDQIQWYAAITVAIALIGGGAVIRRRSSTKKQTP